MAVGIPTVSVYRNSCSVNSWLLATEKSLLAQDITTTIMQKPTYSWDALGRAMVKLHGGKTEKIKTIQNQPNIPALNGSTDEVTSNYNKRGPHYPPSFYREMGRALKP